MANARFSKTSKTKRMRRKGYKRVVYNYKGPRPEIKYIDTGANPYTVTTTGALQCMNAMAKGTSNSQRIGNRVNAKFAKLFGDIYTTDNSAAMTRLILFYDKQTNGAAPSVTSLLVSASPYSNYLQETKRHRFTILYDRMFYTDSEFKNKIFKINRKLRFQTEYYNTSDTGLVGDIQKGSLYLLAISTNSNARLTLTNRFFYTDY